MKNRKKIITLFLICIMIFVFGCGKESKDSESIILTNEATLESIEAEIENSNNKVISDAEGISFEDLPDDIKGLIIPIDSLLFYHAETGAEYAPENPEMFWKVMHFAIGNFGEFYNRAELIESELAVESMDAAEFATSFIAGFGGFPQIPDSMSYEVRYNSEEDIYYFGVGDRGLSQTEILSYEYIDNNTLKMTARLFALDDDSTICKGEFMLVRNEYAAGVMEPLFYFSVSEAEFDVE